MFLAEHNRRGEDHPARESKREDSEQLRNESYSRVYWRKSVGKVHCREKRLREAARCTMVKL